MIKTTIEIEGMACGMCEAHVNDALRNVIQAKKITSSHKKKQSIVISETDLNEEEVKKAINDTGYTYISMHSEPYKKKLSFLP